MINLFAISMLGNESDIYLLKYCNKQLRKHKGSSERVSELIALKKIAQRNILDARQQKTR